MRVWVRGREQAFVTSHFELTKNSLEGKIMPRVLAGFRGQHSLKLLNLQEFRAILKLLSTAFTVNLKSLKTKTKKNAQQFNINYD